MSADITRRSLTAAMALGPFLSIARAQGQRPVKVGTNNIYGVAATFPANGDDKPADGAIEIIRFNSVPAMLQALDAGELDVAEVGEVGPVVAQAAGIPIKIVAATQPWPEGEAIIVYKTSSIRSVKELVGKKVSYPRATNAQWLLTKALRAEGLKITDVVSVTLPAGTNILAVLETGGVDASVFIDASLSQYEAEGARRILNAGEAGCDNSLFYIATEKAVAQQRAGVGLFVRQLHRHLAWARNNQETRARAVAELLRIPYDVALASERKRPAGLRPIDRALIVNGQDIADTFLAQAVIPQPIKVDSTFTEEFNAFIGA
ncbi:MULTISPECIES: ABC transporter substrate-binding protein [unclassified Beijerinckia]|uniref:ABC transporter substrate-binding protein n=1 Tax=unclassified Beijerinckia TaxID=2638183 RepID=UPI00089C220B|nr:MULTISPECIES: ABC transporter substrate-binding protein [unclassified Beijerinckia]MDH7798723.1 sulfonate transport system substrate-binding protein [Beijerinckia sp. GAS462]SED30874.1 sulfonate transport system substrate-binding protein [Beijerinckia sp. 28-YEA-48]